MFLLQYAYGLLQSNKEEVCAIQERISKMHRLPEDNLVFLLGVTNHWVTLFVHKSKENGISVFYLDSNNEPVLMASETNLRSLVQARENKHIKRKGHSYSPWKKKVLYQSFVDQRDVVEILVKCVSGKVDLRGEMAIQTWNKLLDSYDCVVKNSNEDNNRDLLFARLIEWLQEHYPSKVIIDHHMEILRQFHQLMDKHVLLRIKEWINSCAQLIPDACGLESLESFYLSIDKLKAFVDISIH